MHSARLQDLTCWAAIDIADCVVAKRFIAKDAFFASKLRFAQRIAHVGANPPRLTRHIVFTGAILVIGHHDLRLAAGIALVLLEQVHQLFVLRN